MILPIAAFNPFFRSFFRAPFVRFSGLLHIRHEIARRESSRERELISTNEINGHASTYGNQRSGSLYSY